MSRNILAKLITKSETHFLINFWYNIGVGSIWDSFPKIDLKNVFYEINLGNVMRCETLEILAPISSSRIFAPLSHSLSISLIWNFFISSLQLPDLSTFS